MADVPESITVSKGGFTLPTSEILTGRGFITGKSGSGKSTTASVIAEELLEQGLPMLIVDTDGEYYGLKGRYELLHVGADAVCDATVGPEHAEKLAELALVQNVPVVLDLSGFLEETESRELFRRVIERLFELGQRVRKPFLVLVEEVHEFLPQSGKSDELSETLIAVAKRGRKRGIGICGMSQRPAAVDKNYITQCDWVVWHRLTWDNDKRVATQMLGEEVASDIDDLETGEALVMTDWDDRVNRVHFRPKRTYDAGATPGLDDLDADTYRPVHTELLSELSGERTDLNDVDLEELAAGRRVPEAPADTPVDDLEEVVDGTSAGSQAGRPTTDESPSGGGGRAADHGEAGGEVVTISSRPARPSSTPRTTDGDEAFDPVWELGHLVVHLLTVLGRGLLGLVGAFIDAAVDVRYGLDRVGRVVHRSLVRPVARDLERVAAHQLPDRAIAVAIVVLLAVAGALLLLP